MRKATSYIKLQSRHAGKKCYKCNKPLLTDAIARKCGLTKRYTRYYHPECWEVLFQ